MPSNKKHHYVPKFYLRNFSLTDKTINIYNIDSDKNIVGGSLKDQCYVNRFYGKDSKIEYAFSLLEGAASRLIRTILEDNQLPSEESTEYNSLLIFVVLQYGRTKYAADTNDEMLDKFFKTTYRDRLKRDNIKPTDFQVGLNDPIGLPLKISATYWPIVRDLKAHLILNETEVEFITSDNPVTLYNKYCEKIKDRSSAGLGSVGLLIFFPLSPKALLLLYDGAVYKVGSRRSRSTLINDQNDIMVLNRLQWYNAMKNVYYHGLEQVSYMQRESKSVKKRRVSHSNIQVREYLEKDDGTEREAVLHMYKSLLPMELNISFLKVQRRKKKVPMEKRLGSRDPELLVLLDEFSELVRKGYYKGSEFGLFIRDKKLTLHSAD